MTFIGNVLTDLIKFEFQRTGAFSGLCTKLIVWHGFCYFVPKKAFPMLVFPIENGIICTKKIVTINLDSKLLWFFFSKHEVNIYGKSPLIRLAICEQLANTDNGN